VVCELTGRKKCGQWVTGNVGQEIAEKVGHNESVPRRKGRLPGVSRTTEGGVRKTRGARPRFTIGYRLLTRRAKRGGRVPEESEEKRLLQSLK
jgi:hypothetical protein